MPATPSSASGPADSSPSEQPGGAVPAGQELARARENTPLVLLDGASVRFGDRLVLQNLSLCIYRREHTALIGPNGAGKSTVLKLIGAELRLSQIVAASSLTTVEGNGAVLWGFSGTLLPHALEAKEHVRLVSPWQQGEYLRQEWKITGEEIALSGYANSALLYDVPHEDRKKAVRALFRQAGLAHLVTMQAPAMSQGQLRACLVLRALAAQPALLLLDEPFDGLDARARKTLARLMKMAAENNTTLVVTSHRPEDIPFFISRFLHLEEGTLTSRPRSALYRPDHQKHPAHMPEELAPMRGKAMPSSLAYLKRKAERVLPQDAPVFDLQHVDVFIDRQQVLHDINWTVNRGEQWRVSGLNGSGKSTLLRLLYGDEFAAYGGTLTRLGRKKISLPRLRGLVGLVSDRLQQTYAYDITAHEVVLSGFDGSEGVYRDYSRHEVQRAVEWERELALERFLHVPCHSLSTGQARRVLLARALAAAHPVLLFDEPFSGLDAESRDLCLATLSLLVQNSAQIIFVSHREDDCLPLFSHELALEEGQVVYCGPVR